MDPLVEIPKSNSVNVTEYCNILIVQHYCDGLKDIKGVIVEFNGEKAVLTGEVSKADRMKIMQMLSTAKVKSDVSKLMDKK